MGELYLIQDDVNKMYWRGIDPNNDWVKYVSDAKHFNSLIEASNFVQNNIDDFHGKFIVIEPILVVSMTYGNNTQ